MLRSKGRVSTQTSTIVGAYKLSWYIRTFCNRAVTSFRLRYIIGYNLIFYFLIHLFFKLELILHGQFRLRQSLFYALHASIVILLIISKPINLRPVLIQETAVDPLPENGSQTSDPGCVVRANNRSSNLTGF